MNDVMLIFVSPNFKFCLHAETAMAARFSFRHQRNKRNIRMVLVRL